MKKWSVIEGMNDFWMQRSCDNPSMRSGVMEDWNRYYLRSKLWRLVSDSTTRCHVKTACCLPKPSCFCHQVFIFVLQPTRKLLTCQERLRLHRNHLWLCFLFCCSEYNPLGYFVYDVFSVNIAFIPKMFLVHQFATQLLQFLVVLGKTVQISSLNPVVWRSTLLTRFLIWFSQNIWAPILPSMI